jgi:hypothetical protein
MGDSRMVTNESQKVWRERLATVGIVLVLTFAIGLVRSSGVTKEMIWDWLATSAALSIGLIAGKAIMQRYG